MPCGAPASARAAASVLGEGRSWCRDKVCPSDSVARVLRIRSRLSWAEDDINYERRRREGRVSVMTRLTVAAGAEWVSAPMEMRSAPAAAMARTLFRVMPPDTSTRACFLINVTARRTRSGAMLSSKIISGFPASACRTSARDSTSTIIGSALERRACSGRPVQPVVDCVGGGRMVIFDQNAVTQ